MCTHASTSVRVLVGLALLAGGVARAAEEGTFQRTLPASPQGELQVSSVAGTVEITGWDRPQVDVNAAYDEGIERIDVRGERDRIVVKVIVRQHHRGQVQLKIRAPKNNEVEVTAVSADVRAKGILGKQRLKTVSGDITTEVAAGDVETKTVSGNVALRGSGQPSSVRATSVSGDIRYDRGRGDLEASTVSGDLSALLQPARDIRVRTTSGGISITGSLLEGGAIEGESISGELSVHVKAEAGFRYEANSFSGDIVNCFNVSAERVSQYGPGHRLSGERGKGEGEVRLKALSGDVDLCDR